MTKVDLRIKYKSETGFRPVWIYDSQRASDYRCDSLTPEYAEWLEGRNADVKRKLYKRNTGDYPFYYDKNRNIVYFKAYKLWLEEWVLKGYTILERIQ